MSARLQAICGRYGRNKSIAFLAVVVLALTTALSGAIYVVTTSSDASTNAGSITMTNSKSGNAVVDASNMKPGDSRNDTVTIHNTGDAANYHLSGDAATGTGALLSTLTITGNQNYVDLGNFAADETRTYKVTVAWPSNQTDPALQAKTASRVLHFDASQL